MLIASSTAVWYAARAGGVVAYLLVSASVLAGITLAGKRSVPDGSTRTVRASWTVSDGAVSGTISTSGGSSSTDA